MDDFHLAPYGRASEDENREECEALKAWLVYNVFAVEVMQRHAISQDAKEILDQALLDEVAALARLYAEHLQTGELAESHPLRDVDGLLLRLGSKSPELGSLVSTLLGIWNRVVKEREEVWRDRFDEVLNELLPDIITTPSLDGKVIGMSALRALEDFEANLAFANSFKELVDQPEWGNPFESVRELVSTDLHKINLYTGDEVYGPRSVAVIQRIIHGMSDKPNLIFPSSALGLASADSASIESIIDGLRDYIATGRKSFADCAGVASLHQGKLREVVEALDLMRDLVGPDKVHLVTNSDLRRFIASGRVETGMLFGDWVNVEGVPVIAINMSVKSLPDEEVANRTREILQGSHIGPAHFVAGAIRHGVANYVVPSLAATEGGADHEGFVGFKPLTAVAIAERKEMVRTLPRDSIGLAYVLQVQRVSGFDDSEALEPVDVDDTSLIPSR